MAGTEEPKPAMVNEDSPRSRTVEDIRALDRAQRSGQAADLNPGISHDHAFEVAGLQLSASLYVPASLNRPSALWVIPAHPSQTLNSDKHFEFMLAGLPQDALILWSTCMTPSRRSLTHQ